MKCRIPRYTQMARIWTMRNRRNHAVVATKPGWKQVSCPMPLIREPFQWEASTLRRRLNDVIAFTTAVAELSDRTRWFHYGHIERCSGWLFAAQNLRGMLDSRLADVPAALKTRP